MKEEVIIVPGKRENIFKKGDLDGEFEQYVYNWDTYIAINREPQYVAYYVTGTGTIRAIAEIDYKKSKFGQGIIAIIDEPIRVIIPVRFGKDTLQGIRYTTFKKLLTHESTDDL